MIRGSSTPAIASFHPLHERVLGLFRFGADTENIARICGLYESDAARLLADARERDRAGLSGSTNKVSKAAGGTR